MRIRTRVLFGVVAALMLQATTAAALSAQDQAVACPDRDIFLSTHPGAQLVIPVDGAVVWWIWGLAGAPQPSDVPPGQPPARGMGVLAADDCAFVPLSADGNEITRVFPSNPTVWLFQQVYTPTGNAGWAYIATDDLEPYVPQSQCCPE